MDRQSNNPTLLEFLIPFYGLKKYNSRCSKLNTCNDCSIRMQNETRLGVAHGLELSILIYGTFLSLYSLLK